MMQDLPPYNESPTCPKCGNSRPTAFGLLFRNSARPGEHGWPYLDCEHLARECLVCHYKWSEACVDDGYEMRERMDMISEEVQKVEDSFDKNERDGDGC